MQSLQERICLVVAASTVAEFLSCLQSAQATRHLLELRIDTIVGIDLALLQQILDSLTVPAIVTCRAKAHGGEFAGSVAEQNSLLQLANDAGCAYVDVDVGIAAQVHIENQRCRLIISHHDFAKTPANDQLLSVIEVMQQRGADVLKIATQCQSQQDARRLLSLLLAKPADQAMIVLGMGAMGKITRLLAPLLGGYLTFTSLQQVDEALGHIPYKKLQGFYESITDLCQ